MFTPTYAHAELESARWMADQIAKPGRRVTLGADKANDRRDFVGTARDLGLSVQVTQNKKGRRSAIDGRTSCHTSYATSSRPGWLVGKAVGWMKQSGGLNKLKPGGLERVGWPSP